MVRAYPQFYLIKHAWKRFKGLVLVEPDWMEVIRPLLPIVAILDN